MKDWFEGHEWSLFHEDRPRKTMAPYWAIVAIIAGLAAAFVSVKLHAEPIARADAGKWQITLHKEKCALDAVSNLPQRATWTEGGATFEGCFGIRRAAWLSSPLLQRPHGRRDSGAGVQGRD